MSSLKAANFEVNTELESFYAGKAATRSTTNPYNLTEYFDSAFKQKCEGAKAFSEVAIVVFGRYAGETIDEIPLKQGGTSKTYLEITDEEKNLLTYIKTDLGFEKIIVVLNAANEVGDWCQLCRVNQSRFSTGMGRRNTSSKEMSVSVRAMPMELRRLCMSCIRSVLFLANIFTRMSYWPVVK